MISLILRLNRLCHRHSKQWWGWLFGTLSIITIIVIWSRNITCYNKAFAGLFNTLSQEKMDIPLRATSSYAISWIKTFILIEVLFKFVSNGSIKNNPASGQIMAWQNHYLNQWWLRLLTDIWVPRLHWVISMIVELSDDISSFISVFNFAAKITNQSHINS